MSTCQYFGQTSCLSPSFGGGSSDIPVTPHENLIERYLFLGTSPFDWVVNCILWLLIFRFFVWPFVVTPILNWIDFRRRERTKMMTFELIPFRTSSIAIDSMSEFFTIVHSQLSVRGHEYRLFHKKERIALEIVAKHDGMRYIVRLPESEVELFMQSVVSLYPDIKYKEVHEYNLSSNERMQVAAITSFRQLRHFIYPLRKHINLNIHDPVAYIASTMSALKHDELLAIQLVVSPFEDFRQLAKMRNKIAAGMDPLVFKYGGSPFLGGLMAIYDLMKTGIIYVYNLAAFILNLLSGHFSLPGPRSAFPGTLPSSSRDIQGQIIQKLEEPLFFTDIRVLISTRENRDALLRSRGVAGALTTFDSQGYQALRRHNILSEELINRVLHFPIFRVLKLRIDGYKIHQFMQGNLSLFWVNTNVLSVSELADLYHFPPSETAATEGLTRSMSRMLPAPNHFKLEATARHDVVLGQNIYHGHYTPIGLTTSERKRHVYIVGGTGNGKTTMLEYAIEQDIRRGKGVAVIDPHGDLAQKILTYIPEDRIKDVIYFNPSDLAFPIGVNLLEFPEGLSDDELLNEKDFIVESVVSIFRKIFSDDDSGGHRIEYILRNAVHTAMTVEGATLFTVLKLLRNTAYRREVVTKLEDQDLRDFWREELGKAGDFQRVKMTAGITSKIDRFRRSEAVRRTIDQKKSTINFDEILDGKILICNLAKGLIGEDTSELLGIAILTKLQLAAYRRIRKSRSKRRPFFIYVDEFQNFATTQFIQMLSEARKYGLVLTMAEQSTSQQYEQKMVEVILNNVGVLICFRTGNGGDEKLLLPHFKPYIQGGDIGSLPAYNFYIRIRAEEAYEPTSGVTILLKTGKAGRVKKIQNNSRRNYAMKALKVDKNSIINDEKNIAKTEVPIIEPVKNKIELG